MKPLLGKTITLHQFPTHIACTNNKKAPNKYVKLNNQLIYNNALATYTRAIVVNNIQEYILANIPDNFGKLKVPVKPIFDFYLTRNHGQVRRYHKTGVISAPLLKSTYVPNWDDDNVSFLWIKMLKDAFTRAGIWKNDSVQYSRGGEWDTIFIDKFENRKIVINFIPLR